MNRTKGIVFVETGQQNRENRSAALFVIDLISEMAAGTILAYPGIDRITFIFMWIPPNIEIL